MGSRRRSCCLKPSISASISLWIIFLSSLNSQAFRVTAPHCVSDSSLGEPFSSYSYLSKPMSIESASSPWRSVVQPWPLNAQDDLPVAATLLLTCSNSWISLRPDLKILWHLLCSLYFGMIVTLPTGKICSLSLMVEPVNGDVKFWNDTLAMKSPMILFQIQHELLLLFSESNENSQCVLSFKPHLVIKDYMLWCYPRCLLHSLRYGNAEDQSCSGIVASDGMSELMEGDKLLSNYVHIIVLGVAMGLWQEIKVLINKPLIAIINTSFSIAKIHSLQKQKLVSVYPLNLTTMEKFIQHSSRQSRERSSSPFLLFVGENLSIKSFSHNSATVISVSSPLMAEALAVCSAINFALSYRFDFGLLSTHLSFVSFPLSISFENLFALTSDGFKFQCCNQRGCIILSIYYV